MGTGLDHAKMIENIKKKVNSEMLAHGRGITMALNIFDQITYNNKGNRFFWSNGSPGWRRDHDGSVRGMARSFARVFENGPGIRRLRETGYRRYINNIVQDVQGQSGNIR